MAYIKSIAFLPATIYPPLALSLPAPILMPFGHKQNFLLDDPENPIEAGSAEDTYKSSEKDVLIAFNDWLVDKLAEEA